MKAATENNDKTKMSLIRSLYTWKALSIMSLVSVALTGKPEWYYYGNYCFYILSFYRSDGFKNRIPT